MPDRFNSALYAVSPRLREALQALPDGVKRRVFEIRLRCGQPVALTLPDGTGYLSPEGGCTRVLTTGSLRADPQEVRRSFSLLCEYSVHVHERELAAGFVAMRGGHRAGISGKMAVQGGRIASVGEVYGINIRIAREVSDIAAPVVSGLLRDFGGMKSFFYFGPPGCGKTTYLRDTARLLSQRGYRCVLVDERGELGDFCEGAAGFDFGPGCDILSGCPKTTGIEMAVRTLNPQVILFDEIGGPEEAQAVSAGFCSGVRFVTTLHAGSLSELAARPTAAPLLSPGVFGAAVFLPEVFAKPEILILGGERDAADGYSDAVCGRDGGGIYEKHVS
ncbi:MAG: hypothetical protein ACOYKJ_07420 [Candidatus Howiella sp.]|jgi:stage III sporulation protein AA